MTLANPSPLPFGHFMLRRTPEERGIDAAARQPPRLVQARGVPSKSGGEASRDQMESRKPLVVVAMRLKRFYLLMPLSTHNESNEMPIEAE